MGTIYRNGTAFIGSGGAGGVELTQAEYDALPTTEKMNGSIYFISDGETSYPSASTMRYDNSTSGLTATSVQDAVDEVNEKVNDNALDIAELNNGLVTLGDEINCVIPLGSTGWVIGSISTPTKSGYTLVGYLLRTNTYRIVSMSYQISGTTTSINAYVSSSASTSGNVFCTPIFKKN